MSECNQEKLMLLAAGELDAGQTAAIQEHVAACDRCAGELAALGEALGSLDRLAVMEPSGRAVERTREAAHRVVRRYRLIRPNFVRRYRLALSTAAALFLVLAGSMVNDAFKSQPGAQQLRAMWNGPSARTFESGIMAEDLADRQAADEWSGATRTLIASVRPVTLSGELIDIQDSLGTLEDQVNNTLPAAEPREEIE
jgi:anti-sigma factor RsiW